MLITQTDKKLYDSTFKDNHVWEHLSYVNFVLYEGIVVNLKLMIIISKLPSCEGSCNQFSSISLLLISNIQFVETPRFVKLFAHFQQTVVF